MGKDKYGIDNQEMSTYAKYEIITNQTSSKVKALFNILLLTKNQNNRKDECLNCSHRHKSNAKQMAKPVIIIKIMINGKNANQVSVTESIWQWKKAQAL